MLSHTFSAPHYLKSEREMWEKKELFTSPMGLQRHQLVNISQVYHLCPVTLLYSYLQFKGKDNKECCIFHYHAKRKSLIFCICKVQSFIIWCD